MFETDWDEGMGSEMRPHSTHFYTVISSHDATRYHPPSQRSPLVLQPPCDFSPHHVTKACIENHLQRSCTAASPFITLFHSFGTVDPLSPFCRASSASR